MPPQARAATLGVQLNGADPDPNPHRLNASYAWYDAANPDLSPEAIAGPPAIPPVGGPGDGPNLLEWRETGFPFGSEQSKITYSGTLPPGVKIVHKEVRADTGFNPWPVGVLAEWAWAGVPTELGVFDVTVNPSSHAGSAGFPGGEYRWTISLAGGCPLIEISPESPLPDAALDVEYEGVTFTAGDGDAPFTWDVPPGWELPDGMALSSGGVLDGTPTVFGSFSFAIRVVDDNGCVGIRVYALEISEFPPIALDDTLPDGARGVAYAGLITAEGGVGEPYVFTLEEYGELPPGVTLSPGGELEGLPTEAGSFTFTVRATDSDEGFGEREYTIAIAGIRIVIGGEDVTPEISEADLELPLNRQATGHLEIGDGYIPARGADVLIYARDGVTPIFDGLVLTRRIQGMTEHNPANRGGVELVDYSLYFDDATVTLAATAPQYLEDVVAEIVDQALAIYGFTYTPTDTGIVLEPFDWKEISVTDAFKRITDATGVVFRARPIKRLDVFVPLADPAPVTITDAEINAFGLEWADGPNLPANTVDLLCGPEGTGIVTKQWTSDGYATEYEVDIPAVVGNAEPARASHGFLGTSGNFAAGDTVTLGSSVYTFRAALVGDVAGEVKIGATGNDSLANLDAAINNAGGGNYAPSTPVNADASSYMRNPDQLAANALITGAAGNSIAVAAAAPAEWYGEGGIPITALQLGNDASGAAGWTQGYVLEGGTVAQPVGGPGSGAYYEWDVTAGRGTISIGSGTVAPAGTVLELRYLAVFPFHARVPAVVGPPPITFREAHPEIVDYDKGIALATKILERESAGDRELEVFTDVDGFLPGQALEVDTTHRGGIEAIFLVATVRVHMVNAELWEYRITAQQSEEYKGSFVEQWKALTSGGSSATPAGALTPTPPSGQTPLAGSHAYYVADTSGGAVTRQLTFTDGVLVSET